MRPRGRALHVQSFPFMSMTDLLGLAAATLTTGAMLPQVIKAWRTRRTEDISLTMFLMLEVGIILWLVYGLVIGETPVIAANAVAILLVSTVLVLKIRFG